MERTDDLSRIVGLLPEPTLLVGGDAVLLAANRHSAALLGRASAQQLVGRTVLDLVDQDADAVLKWLRACARTRTLLPGFLNFTDPNGDPIPCRADGVVLEAASGQEPAKVMVRLAHKRKAVDPFAALNLRIEELTSEVRRRKKAEQALRSEREWFRVTLESIGDAVMTTDSRGRVTFLNPVAETLTGWHRDDAKGRPLGEVFIIINEYTREPAENPVDKVLRDGCIVALANHTILIRRDGTEYSIDDSAAPIRDVNGEVQGVVLVFHEITERRSLERRLRLADQRKDEFLAMLAHELRNPLAPLRSGIELVRADPGRSDRVLRMMERQVGHLTRLVDDLLDVSRITRGSIELRREPTDLVHAIELAQEMVGGLAAARGFEITLGLPEGPLRVHGDAARLSQVFVNLLSNAVKFNKPGGSITVTAELQEDAVTVSVQDTGVGIPEEDLTDIFEPFVQGDRSLDRTEGGLGLGLPVAKRLTELHGGTLEARSNGIDTGSDFIVTLPCIAAPAAGSPAEESLPDPVTDQEAAVTVRRVLVVDDNQDSAQALGMLVELWGHEVAVAHDGIEALEVATAFRPQVVLLDLGLPKLDGFEVARRIRRHPDLAGAVLVAVSGYGRAEDQERTREAGFDQHLVKPVPPGALEQVLNRPARGEAPSTPGP